MKIRTLRKLQFWARIVTASCLLAIVSIEYVWPIAVEIAYRDSYGKLAMECDLAMHDEAAFRSGSSGDKNQSLRLSGDVGLTVCHEYDKLRKKLLIAGVSEEKLALIGLETLENEQIPVSRMADPHRMERF